MAILQLNNGRNMFYLEGVAMSNFKDLELVVKKKIYPAHYIFVRCNDLTYLIYFLDKDIKHCLNDNFRRNKVAITGEFRSSGKGLKYKIYYKFYGRSITKLNALNQFDFSTKEAFGNEEILPF